MVITIRRTTGDSRTDVHVTLTQGTPKCILRASKTEKEIGAYYSEGAFEVMGEIMLRGKSVTSIKCPDRLIEDVEKFVETS